MSECINIYNRYKGQSRIASDGEYFDPDGSSMGTDAVHCINCFFYARENDCVLYKELGSSVKEMREKYDRVSKEQYCDYILTDFDDDDELRRARSEIYEMKQRLFPERFGGSSGEDKNETKSTKNDEEKSSWFLKTVVVLIVLWLIIVYSSGA